MKLHASNQSSSARRVTLVVAHLGIELEVYPVNLGDPEQRARLGKLNPNAKIPVLEDGDFVLWESHAIMKYLCERTFGQTLYPNEMRARADVDRWLFWVSAHLAPTVGPLNFERMWKRFASPTNPEPDLAVLARYEGFFRQFAGVLDRHLDGREWIVGRDVSLADLSVAATLMYMRPTRLPIDAYKHVLAHFTRVQALPAWKATEPPPMAW